QPTTWIVNRCRRNIVRQHHIVRTPVAVTIRAVDISPTWDVSDQAIPGVIAPAIARVVARTIRANAVNCSKIGIWRAAVIVYLFGGRSVRHGDEFGTALGPMVHSIRGFLVELFDTCRSGIQHLARAHQGALAIYCYTQHAFEYL